MASERVEDSSDEGVAPVSADARRVSREARLMSSAAAALAMISLALVGAMVAWPAPTPPPPTSTGRSRPAVVDEIVGLSAARPDATGRLHGPGWHRTYMPSAVREGASRESRVLQELPSGSLVYATAVEGGEYRISRPVAGWMSRTTADGVGAMYPEMPLRGLGEADDVEGALRSDGRAKMNELLRARVADVTAVQQRLAESMRRLKESTSAMRRPAEQLVKGEAPKVARAIDSVAKRAAESQDVKRLVKDLAHQPGLQGLFH